MVIENYEVIQDLQQRTIVHYLCLLLTLDSQVILNGSAAVVAGNW